MSAYSVFELSRSAAVAALFFACVAPLACGRSSLDDGTVFPEEDGGTVGPDAPVGDGPMDAPVMDTSRPPPPGCGPTTCPSGCCDGNGICQSGSTLTQCGRGAAACVDCLGLPNPGCDPTSHTCTSTGPSCSAANCAGCCFGTSCVGGAQSTACGAGGQVCENCTGLGDVCEVSGTVFQCVPPPPPRCSSANCTGCCDGNGVCQAGFVDTLCGQGGGGCADCTASGSTCDVNINPRVCTNQQNQCPSTYPGCAGNLSTPIEPMDQNLCSNGDLQNASSACSAGAHSTACQSFFAFEQAQNAGCAKCLSTFDFDFTELKGILACVSPFVNATCNHDIACIFDCATTSCLKCPDAPSTTQCQGNSVSGTCQPFAQQLQNDQCVQEAAISGGAFCFPMGGGESFGTWLETVGGRYCGQ